MSKLSAVVLASVALMAAAPASAQQAPADKYTLNVVVEAVSGEVLARESLKCDSMRWCAAERRELVVAGKPRVFFIRSRWAGPMAGPRLELDALTKEKIYSETTNRTHSMPFRPGEKEEVLVFDTPDGVSWKGQKAFDRGPVARIRVEIKY